MEMSNSQIDEYRQPWESDEHWALRKEFIEKYKDVFSEDRLLCLAQAYSNVELLGCNYPGPVMRQINGLADGLKVCNDIRQSRKDRASVQFVKEGKNSKNSENRGNKRPPNEVLESCSKVARLPPRVMDFVNTNPVDTLDICTDTLCVELSGEQDSIKRTSLLNDKMDTTVPGNNFVSSPGQICSESPFHVDSPIPQKAISKPLANTQETSRDELESVTSPKAFSADVSLFTRRALLKKTSAIEIIHNAGQKFDFKPVYVTIELTEGKKHPPVYECSLEIDNVLFSTAQGSSKKSSRLNAANLALEKMMKFTLPTISDTENVCSPKKSNTIKPTKTALFKTKNTPTTQGNESNRSVKCNSSRLVVLLDHTDIRRTEGSVATLVDSANFNRVPLKYEFENLLNLPGHVPMIRTHVFLGNHVISSADGYTKQEAKQIASDIALARLKKKTCTIKVKDEHEDAFIVSRNQVLDVTGNGNSLSENNLGCKMLKMMGWSGGGIGKLGNQGIEEPVKTADSHRPKQGLGFADDKDSRDFTARLEQIILEYAKSNSTSDLIFSAEFSKDERKEIHRIANKYNLKNNSKGGKAESRHVIVGRRFTAQELLDHLRSVGGSTPKYELIENTK